MRLAAGLLLIAACAAEPGPMTPPMDDERELPPMGDAALRVWLATGAYETWACETAPHPARPPGAHGANRICSNAVLAASTEGAFPTGAASVKELWSDGAITGYAVGRKVSATSWYWYEGFGTQVVADGPDARLCASCHEDAPRDHVFTVVR